MDVDDAEVAVVGVGDDELGDGVLAHELEGVDGILGVEDGAGVGVHDVGGGGGLPRRLEVISRMVSEMGVEGDTSGRSFWM